MRLRTALIAVTAVALAAPTTPALAAKKPKPVPKVCNLLVDAKGDGTWNMGGGVVKSGALDIVSADIATGGKEFVAVLRLAEAPKNANDHWRNLAYEWRLGATGNGVRYEFKVRHGTSVLPSESTTVTVGGQSVPHKFAIAGPVLTWRFERKVAPALAKPRIVWGDFGANSNAMSSTADTGSSERKYADRAPSCVTAL